MYLANTKGITAPNSASSCAVSKPVCGANLLTPCCPAVVRLGGVLGGFGLGVRNYETRVRTKPITNWVATWLAPIAETIVETNPLIT